MIAGNAANKRFAALFCSEKSTSGSTLPKKEQPVRITSIGCASLGISFNTSFNACGISRIASNSALYSANSPLLGNSPLNNK